MGIESGNRDERDKSQPKGPAGKIGRRTLLRALGIGWVASQLPQTPGGKMPDPVHKTDFYLPPEKKLMLAGTGGCTPQDDPLAMRQSDIAEELRRSIEGKSYKYAGPFDPEKLPHFFRDHRRILNQAKRFGNSYRTSFDFAELCPEKGVFNEELMAKYVQILARCHYLKLEPMMTLHHWPMPKSFATYDAKGNIENGPLEHPDIVDHFAFYIDKVADFLFDPNKIREALKDEGYDQKFLDEVCDEKVLCKWFISINEPANLVSTPYIIGQFPPYQYASFLKRDGLIQKLKAMHGIAHHDLHDKALKAGQRRKDPLKIGMSHHAIPSTTPLYNSLSGWGFNEEMEEGIYTDFTGLQPYYRLASVFAWAGNDPRFISDNALCAQIGPAVVYDVLKHASTLWPGRELLITENGFTDKSDKKRPYWTVATAGHLIRAVRDGINVTSYLYWPLLTNWEWRIGQNLANGLLDHNGNPLPSENEPDHISTTRVLAEVAAHLLYPTPESQAILQSFERSTWDQLVKEVEKEMNVSK